MRQYVKISSAYLCLSLLSLAPVLRAQDQQQPPVTPPAAQQPAAQPPATPAPGQQPQPTSPDQTPLGIRPAPPPLPKIPDVRQPGETGYWISLSAWLPTQQPIFDKGHGATFTEASNLTFQGKPKYGRQLDAGLALGLHNALRITYLDSRASGNFTSATDLVVFNQAYTAGTLITTDYRIQHFKLQFDYLSWPYPVESRKFRFKTIWAVQYTTARAGFDAPLLPLVDSSGAPLVDASGNPLTYATSGTRWFLSPMLGVGVAEYGSRHFRVEANVSGFAIPHHNNIWDADASANFRYGRFELRVGGKAFHFQTSTQSDFFMKGTMGGAFVGLRWYSQ